MLVANILLCEKCPSPSSFNFARLSMLRMLCKKTNDLVVLRVCSTKNVGLIHCMRGATHKPGGLTRYPGYNNYYYCTILTFAIMCSK